ncbi:MAG: MFS transporter [Burkholderiales bacterium]|jgi:ATP-dependent protease HslVU (ClpYQ) peptidase subunit|nr:MFS transporter [Burkholderiales bacterium]
MTTIAVVRKGGQIAIAADTLTKWGTAKESADYVVNSSKLFRVADSWIAITGNATFKHILPDWFASLDDTPGMGSVAELFRTWNRLHGDLKDRYFLQSEEDKEDAVESTRVDVLVANAHGIFGVSGQRTVQEFTRFYAYGSGADYALGAMWSVYDRAELDAEAVARHAIAAAIEFDDGTGPPIESHVVALAAHHAG